jgi:hypothetical protein
MLGDEGGIMQRLREIGEDGGMKGAKSGSLFYPYLSSSYAKRIIPDFLT